MQLPPVFFLFITVTFEARKELEGRSWSSLRGIYCHGSRLCSILFESWVDSSSFLVQFSLSVAIECTQRSSRDANNKEATRTMDSDLETPSSSPSNPLQSQSSKRNSSTMMTPR
eukprot:scaffold7826_cov101-Cylindrotheca_fusiformis.AAC.1